VICCAFYPTRQNPQVPFDTPQILRKKWVTINGAQANVEPVDGGRPSGESIVHGQIDIWADNVVVNGLEIVDQKWSVAGRVNRALHENVQILYNYIHSDNALGVGVNLMCEGFASDDTTLKGYVISHNYINLSSSNQAAIALNNGNPNPPGSYTYVYDGLEISHNHLIIPSGHGICDHAAADRHEIYNPVIQGNHINGAWRGLFMLNMHNADINTNEFKNCSPAEGACIVVLEGTVTDNIFRATDPSVYGNSHGLTVVGTAYGSPTGSHDVEVTGNSFYFNNDDTNPEHGARVHNTGCDVNSIVFRHNNFYDGGGAGGGLALRNYPDAVELDAELNWWSDASGAYHPTLNPDGLGGEVSDNIDFEPWLLQEWPSTDTDETKTKEVDGSGTVNDADTAEGIGDVEIDATGDHTVTTAKYKSNPGGGHTFVSTGYYDVHLDDKTSVTSLTIEFCPATEDTVIYYWNGTDWVACSNQVFNPGTGCIVVTITAATQPGLGYLTGGPFATGHAPPEPVGGIVVPVNKVELLAPWIGLVALASLAALTVALVRRRAA
jgi:hypothetical protein